MSRYPILDHPAGDFPGMNAQDGPDTPDAFMSDIGGLYQPTLTLTHVGDSQTDESLNQWRPAFGGHDHGISDRVEE